MTPEMLTIARARLDVVDIYLEHGLVDDARAALGRVRHDLNGSAESIGGGLTK